MIASQNAYFKLLMDSSKKHYDNLHSIDKLREKSEYEALERELKYKKDFLFHAEDKYKLAVRTGDTKQMDELRTTYEQAAEDVYQTVQASAKAKLEEGFKAQEYGAFMKFGLGMNDVALEKEMLGIQKARLDSMEGTSAWFEANMDYLKTSKDLANRLSDIAEDSVKNIRTTKVGMIRSGSFASSDQVGDLMNEFLVNSTNIRKGQTGGDIRGRQVGFENVIAGYENPIITKMANGTVVTTQKAIWKAVAKFQFKDNEEAIKFYQKENERVQTELYGINVKAENQFRQKNMFSDQSQMNLEELSRKEKVMNMIKDIPGAEQEYFEALSEFYGQQLSVAEEIKSMMGAGLIERSTVDIIALMNGTVEDFKNVFTTLQKQFREKNFQQSVLGTAKSFETNADFTNIVGQISGMSGLKDQGYMVDLLKSTGVGSNADPYTSWYNYALETTKTKIRNAESGGDDMFNAYNELFSLLAENADHLKQKADATNKKMEDALGAIEDTLKVRLAEERKSLKGDVYFMDSSRYDIDPAQIKSLRDKLKNNDPDAYMLLEEIKRKVTGVSR
jgi:hypothetical protein